MRLARKLVRESEGPVRICYEAGPCGFILQRQFQAAVEGLTCEVIAPSLTPVRPGDRIKTDRRDARKLAELYRAGVLTIVHPPSEHDESIRDLMRCRERARQDRHRARHRLSKFLLRRGRIYGKGAAWTHRHGVWLADQQWDDPTDLFVFEEYRYSIGCLDQRCRTIDAAIEQISETEAYRERVGWLGCFRGISTMTAMTILAELHGFCRFQTARDLMGYLGLVPSEKTTADRVRRGGLTKTGNSHVRRVLIEASWHARHRPTIAVRLRRRREGQPSWVIGHADRAMIRLHQRYWRLVHRGKPQNKAVAAVARELTGFVWAVLHEGEARGHEANSTQVA